ncbi:hypothetical protein ACFVSS_24825 [Peribacillus butanolivorans]
MITNITENSDTKVFSAILVTESVTANLTKMALIPVKRFPKALLT